MKFFTVSVATIALLVISCDEVPDIVSIPFMGCDWYIPGDFITVAPQQYNSTNGVAFIRMYSKPYVIPNDGILGFTESTFNNFKLYEYTVDLNKTRYPVEVVSNKDSHVVFTNIDSNQVRKISENCLY